jgi:3-hydroxy-9,10-secoandrosta-1,3,5(10)-triene-9,17-dione monooxygenase reductase component
VAARHDGGDHVILVGRVLRLADFGEGAPLVYHRGRYTGLAAAD